MPFERPTLMTIIDRVVSDYQSRLPGTDPGLARSVLNALSRAYSAACHGLYGYISWVSDQIVPDRAEAEFLERFANWWGLKRTAATAAIGFIDVTASTSVLMPTGTLFQRLDGEQFSVDGDTAGSGTFGVSVTAVVAGVNGNTAAATAVTLVSAIPNVDSAAVVSAGGLFNGADAETDDALRQRLRERVQNTPHGGASFDYVAWAKEISGVTRAWAFGSWLGAGTVGLFFVRDNDSPITPDAGEIAAVQTHIDSVRPVTATVTVLAPVLVAQAMTINIAPNTSAVQEAIQDELNDLFIREASVGDGAGAGTILISHVREAISIAAGETDNALVSPTANIVPAAGELIQLGAITWGSV